MHPRGCGCVGGIFITTKNIPVFGRVPRYATKNKCIFRCYKYTNKEPLQGLHFKIIRIK